MGRRGFTLIEVLLALTLTALICAVLYGVAVGTLRTERKIAGFNDAAVLADRIASLLRRDLQGLYVADYAGRDVFRAESHVRLGGAADGITFLTTAPQLVAEDPEETPGVEGFREVTYVALPAGAREGYLALWRREAPVDGDPFRGGRFVLLHDQVESFDLRFVAPDGELAWDEGAEEWDAAARQALPKAVLLELVLSLGTPPERGGDPDRFRRYRLYEVMPLPAGVTLESRKLSLLEPGNPRAKPGQAGPAGGPPGQRGGQNPLLRNLPRGRVPPGGTNPLLELLKRHGMRGR